MTLRYRVSLGLLLAFLVSPNRAEAGWLDSCAKFFGRLRASPTLRPARSHLNTPGQKILILGARGPGEARLRKYVSEANETLAGMALPSRVDIDVTGETEDVFYEYQKFRIVLPADFARDLTRETEGAKRAFLQHEYGHAVFDENFARHSPEWRSWLASAKSHGPLSQGSLPSPPAGLLRLTAPYQELFADLLTVVTQGDPQALSRSLHRFLEPSDPRVRMRDFSGTVFQARFTEPQIVVGEFGPLYGADPLTAPTEKLRKLTDDHLTFAPVRAYLWENFFSRPELGPHRAELMRKTFDAVAREILARQTDPRLAELSFPAANTRLLRALEGALAEYKLK